MGDRDVTEEPSKAEDVGRPQQTTTTGKDELSASAAEGGTSAERDGYGSLGPGTVLAALFVMYAIMIVVSVVIESLHVEMDLIALMAALSAIFSVCALFAMIVMEQDMARVSLGPPQLPALN